MVYNVGSSFIVLLTILTPSAILLGISLGNSVIDENMFLPCCQINTDPLVLSGVGQ